jgi:hypothetical protein
LVSSSSGEASTGAGLSEGTTISGIVWISWRTSEGGRIGEEGCSMGRSRSTGVDISSRSSSESFLSGFFPLSVGDSEAVEGPAVELADDEVGGESLGRRRIELRHERLESAG